jgi:hypothetical protein
MVDEQELHDRGAGVAYGLGARDDAHALFRGRGAARDQLGPALDLAEANPANAHHGEPRVITEVRHEDARLLSRVDEIRALLDLDLTAVDLQLHGRHAVP